MKETYHPKYDLETGNIKLTKVSHFVKCGMCGQNLAINNDGTILIKTFASILDLNSKEITLKCGKCNNYNTISFEDIVNKKAQCLLTV